MIDILHPAHVHFFRHLLAEMTARGHDVLVTARRKDCALELLERFEIPHACISDSARGTAGLAVEFLTRTARFVRRARAFRPDALAGIAGPTIAVAGRVLRCPAYVFYDTEFATLTNSFAYPLATKVITPDCYQKPVGRNHLTYPGYHELAYLHPQRFTPSEGAARALGVDPAEPYVVVRFVGWWATHDRHERGLSPDQKTTLVQRLERHARVILSSEGDVPPALSDRIYRGPVEQLHHLLAFARMCYGESATMASESAVLGTPAVFIATTGRGYTDDQGRLGLVHSYHDDEFEASLMRAEAILAEGLAAKRQAAAARARLLAEKIDVTGYMIDFFEARFGTGRSPRPAGEASLGDRHGDRLLSAARR